MRRWRNGQCHPAARPGRTTHHRECVQERRFAARRPDGDTDVYRQYPLCGDGAGTVPLIGASVQLYAAGSTGKGSATAIGSASTTDTTGAFRISAPYTCPFNLSVLYLIARWPDQPHRTVQPRCRVDGNAGGLQRNLHLGQLTVNEATTVASAYAFAQFLSTGGNVGASATNFSGLLLAAGSEANLVNTATGQAPGANFPATGTAPTPILNTIADTLNACIVSSGSACSSLYSATAVSGSTPSNTLDAMINLAHNPATGTAKRCSR